MYCMHGCMYMSGCLASGCLASGCLASGCLASGCFTSSYFWLLRHNHLPTPPTHTPPPPSPTTVDAIFTLSDMAHIEKKNQKHF